MPRGGMEVGPAPAAWELYFCAASYEEVCSQFPVGQFLALGTQLVEEHNLLWPIQSQKEGTFTRMHEMQAVGLECVEVSYVDQLEPALVASGLKDAFRSAPDEAIGCFGVATYMGLTNAQAASAIAPQQGKVAFRISSYESKLRLVNVGASTIGRFCQLEGTVIRVSQVQQLVTSMPFRCLKCDAETLMYFRHGEYDVPKCPTTGCRKSVLEPMREKAVSMDMQVLKLQEKLSRANTEDSGRVPALVVCEVTCDLVDKCVPGDLVTVCGIIKSLSVRSRAAKKTTESMYSLYMDTNSVVCDSKEQGMKPLTARERKLVSKIAARSDVFQLIVNSIAPKIFGNELVKAGLALALFGGVQKYAEDKNKITVRGDSHVLLVGDPGLGKSQLLTYVSQIAPRGIFVCGSYSTKAGLTVTLSKDKAANGYAIEAGALLLADQGVCCIDEFDKMKKQHTSLLEAMEQQCVSIAKAGIVCTLPARASVIAAGNPVGGQFSKQKTVAENLKISPAMLSRFDLVFIMMDKPDARRDEMVCRHVMDMHSGGGSAASAPIYTVSNKPLEEQSLEERLKVNPVAFARVALPPELLRQYLSYAKQRVKPKMTQAAAAVLQAFYLNLRENHKTADSTPITTRQLESLIRLAEARAKLELSQYISEVHATEVVEIMKVSLFQSFEDEYGCVDFRKAGGMSHTKEIRRFVRALQHQAVQKGSKVFGLEELRKVAANMDIRTKGSFRDFLDLLNYQNFLLKQAGNRYKLSVQ